mmetsp:Transcript_1681/g.3366  ORF Transcript_1681/g.3366 Transcript_1681/m.3366 type:complete len:212 (-) Transcript_1681:1804-2439(-)
MPPPNLPNSMLSVLQVGDHNHRRHHLLLCVAAMVMDATTTIITIPIIPITPMPMPITTATIPIPISRNKKRFHRIPCGSALSITRHRLSPLNNTNKTTRIMIILTTWSSRKNIPPLPVNNNSTCSSSSNNNNNSTYSSSSNNTILGPWGSRHHCCSLRWATWVSPPPTRNSILAIPSGRLSLFEPIQLLHCTLPKPFTRFVARNTLPIENS